LKKLRFPDPLVLLVCCVLLAALASYLVPAGEYDRVVDEATGRTVVVAGTFQHVDPAPVGFFAAIVALPLGLIDAAEVVFLIFLIGAAFTVVDATGALRGGIEWLMHRMRGSDLWILPIVSLPFAIGGVIENLQEEMIALIPVLLILTRRLGLPPLAAALVTIGPAMIGSAFSPMNPFQVGIAQGIAELPLMSGWGLRVILLVLALAFWMISTMRWAQRVRTEPEEVPGEHDSALNVRHVAILALVGSTFSFLVYGILGRGWGFNEMSALFFIMGVVVGLVGRLGLQGTASAYAQGFRDMAYAAMVVGFARAIFVVLSEGRIVDSIVHALFTPIENLPTMLAALGMMVAHLFIHFPVPSVSGHAVLTMPILVPLGDLLGISRQVVVLAYQSSAGLADLVIPTNGSLLAILAAGGLRYDEWIKWTFPRFLVLLAGGAVAVLVAVAIGWQ
jgi:uncharacterized ion transporter superfamily protein YfcC